MLVRLAGFPPFWHRKQLVMLRNIMNGHYEFVSPEWDDISDKAKDMVSFLCSEEGGVPVPKFAVSFGYNFFTKTGV